jgi:hypothetical protein
MLQRLFLTALLIASFGFAQMGAVTHEISHYAGLNLQQQSAETSKHLSQQTQKNHGQESHSCEKCVGYAGLAHALASSTLVLQVAATANQPHIADAEVIALSIRFNYSARAPPKLA